MFKYNEKNYKSIKELSNEVGVPYTTLLHRLDKGHSLDEAVKLGNEAQKQLIVDGKTFNSIAAASRFFNLNQGTVASRLRSGWTPEEALGLIKRSKKSPENLSRNPVFVNNKLFPSLSAAARHFGMRPNLVNKRVKNNGLTIEQALELAPFPEFFTPGKGQHAVMTKEKRLQKESETGLKMCSCCKKQKPLHSFHTSNNNAKTTRCRDCVSESFLRYRYKISVSEFWKLYEKQSGCCGICGKNLELNKNSTWRPKTVAVDHCHKTEKVRGILCSLCNTGLGSFRDNVTFLEHAIQYLNANH